MKKVSGYITIRFLGCHCFEFYVDDNATYEEVYRKVNNFIKLNYDYKTVEGCDYKVK